MAVTPGFCLSRCFLWKLKDCEGDLAEPPRCAPLCVRRHTRTHTHTHTHTHTRTLRTQFLGWGWGVVEVYAVQYQSAAGLDTDPRAWMSLRGGFSAGLKMCCTRGSPSRLWNMCVRLRGSLPLQRPAPKKNGAAATAVRLAGRFVPRRGPSQNKVASAAT